MCLCIYNGFVQVGMVGEYVRRYVCVCVRVNACVRGCFFPVFCNLSGICNFEAIVIVMGFFTVICCVVFNDKLCTILLWSEKKNIVAITFVYPV